MLQDVMYERRKKEVCDIILKVLYYFEYVYAYNCNKDTEKEVELYKSLIEKTKFNKLYLDFKLVATKDTFSTASITDKTIYLTKQDFKYGHLDYTVTKALLKDLFATCVQYLNVDSIPYDVMSRLKLKDGVCDAYTLFYSLLILLRIVPKGYESIITEDELLLDAVTNTILTY